MMTRYLANCGLLLVPILVWNVAFARYLPPALTSDFNRDIPAPLLLTENVLRLVVMVVPFLLPLDVTSPGQRRGLWLFVAGALVYATAWIPLMVAPESSWSKSRLGFLAPAYTPLVWLVGLGLTGRRFFWSVPFEPWMYLLLAGAFVMVHFAHAHLAYQRARAALP